MTGHRRHGTSAWPSETSAKPPDLMPDAHEWVSGRVLEPVAAEVAWHGSISSSVSWLPSPAQSH